MEVSNKVVSIIIPCYNQSQYLDEALYSVIQQTYVNWECVIVDDGSKDNTEEIAEVWCEKDSRIKYIYQSNAGLANARNFGIESCKGTYILPLDADDKIHSTYLEKAIPYLEDKSNKVIYCEAEYFGAKSGKWEIMDYTPEMMARHNLIFCSALFRKEDFYSVGGYNANMKYGWEDWDFWISILKNGGTVVRIPEVLFYYRVKEDSMIIGMNQKKTQIMLMQIYLNHSDFFDQYFKTPIEVFHDYTNLKKFCNELQADNLFLRGIFKFEMKSYKALFRKLF